MSSTFSGPIHWIGETLVAHGWVNLRLASALKVQELQSASSKITKPNDLFVECHMGLLSTAGGWIVRGGGGVVSGIYIYVYYAPAGFSTTLNAAGESRWHNSLQVWIFNVGIPLRSWLSPHGQHGSIQNAA